MARPAQRTTRQPQNSTREESTPADDETREEKAGAEDRSGKQEPDPGSCFIFTSSHYSKLTVQNLLSYL